jgi:hypothetical protein
MLAFLEVEHDLLAKDQQRRPVVQAEHGSDLRICPCVNAPKHGAGVPLARLL